jgi:hypothetical protein
MKTRHPQKINFFITSIFMETYLQLYYKYRSLYLNGGGTVGLFNNTTKFYLMANITDKYIYDRLDERRDILLNGHQSTKSMLHVTLLQLDINQGNPNSFIFYNETFHNALRKFYNSSLVKHKVSLTSKLGEYDILGKSDNKFFVKVYKPDQPLVITKFRMMFYKYLESLFGKPIIKTKLDSSGNVFYLFYYPNDSLRPLFAVPEFNYGKGKWTPHISIVSTKDLQRHNVPLYNKYMDQPTVQAKIKLLFDKIHKAKFNPIGTIRFDKHVSGLTVSLRNPTIGISKKFDI